ncbi:hypothetical protein Tco_1516505 [Tanacetum coccineum]
MHTRASNSELVEPLPELERTLNRRLYRPNRSVPFEQRNNPPQHPRIIYPPILNINYFCHFLNIFRNYNPLDDEPIWATDRVVARTPTSAITIPETANEFAIKGNAQKLPWSQPVQRQHYQNLLPWSQRNNQEVLNAAAGGIFLYKTPNQAYHLLEDKFLLKLDWAKNQKTKKPNHLLRKPLLSPLKYKDFQYRSKQSKFDDDDIPMSREEEAKFMQTFQRTRFYNDYRDRDSNRDNWRSSRRNNYNRDNYQSHSNDKPVLQKQLSDFIKAQHSTNSFVKDTFMDPKNKLETTTKNRQASIQNLEVKFNRLADKQFGRPSGSLPSNTQPNTKGSSSKPYQPPQARNEHVNVVFIRSGKSYDPLDNLNDQQNNSKTSINFDSDDENDEPTPQPKPETPTPVKETPTPKPCKPKILYPQCLRKEKIEAQYGKFLDMILADRINIPLIDDLAIMPNYFKFLKELVKNKHKIEQILTAFLSDESFAILQNKVPPKLGDPRSFLIPCNFNKAFSAKNMLVEVGKFTFPDDFVILEMEEDSKVPLILGRPFLYTADAVI